MPFRVIDLFCGAGGLSLGFIQNHVDGEPDFEPVWANDFNDWACDTYNANFESRFGAHCVSGDILSVLADPATVVPEADVVVGGPPCQGFSLLNRNRTGDERRAMWEPFLDVVERSGAGVFVMENVPQLLNSTEHHAIEARAHEMGFQTKAARLIAADYGTPQVRKRAFIIGCRFADPQDIFPPVPTHAKPVLTNLPLPMDGLGGQPLPLWKTVRDAIGNLAPPESSDVRPLPSPLNLHFGRNPSPISMKRYRQVPLGGNRFDLLDEDLPPCWKKKTSGGTDLFGRLWWDRPAVTIRTEFFKPEKGRYLHPDQHRPITHREAARLQDFPDDFIFKGTKIEIARQIGNAVPPSLAKAVAGSVRALLQMREAERGEQHFQEEALWPIHLRQRTAVA